MFKSMSDKELAAYIKGAHMKSEYDQYFEAACLERNSRVDAYIDECEANDYNKTL